MAWNSIGSLTYSIAQWLTTVLVVRLSTGYDAAGQYALAMAMSNIFAQIATYRIRAYQVSDIHEKTTSSQYIGLRIVTVSLAFLITVIYSLASVDSTSIPTIIFYLVYRAYDSFTDVLYGSMQQHFRLDYAGKSLLIRSVSMLVSFTAGLLLFNSINMAILLMFVFSLPILKKDLVVTNQMCCVIPDFNLNVIVKLFVECLPAVLGAVFCNSVVTISRQYLSSHLGSYSLGIYASICTPTVLIQACASYLYAPLLGVFATKIEKNKIKEFRILLIKTMGAFLILTLVTSLGFCLIGKPLLAIVFGKHIVKYSNLMYPGIFAAVITAVVAFFSDLLIAVRDIKGNLIGNAIGCCLSIPASIIAINSCGMNGTSYAVIVSYIFASIAMTYRIHTRVTNKVQ